MFTSEILQFFVSVQERTFPSFHLVVCFLWRSKVSGTEPHKPRCSGVLTLEQFQGHTKGQMGWWHCLESIDGLCFCSVISGLYTKFED